MTTTTTPCLFEDSLALGVLQCWAAKRLHSLTSLRRTRLRAQMGGKEKWGTSMIRKSQGGKPGHCPGFPSVFSARLHENHESRLTPPTDHKSCGTTTVQESTTSRRTLQLTCYHRVTLLLAHVAHSFAVPGRAEPGLHARPKADVANAAPGCRNHHDRATNDKAQPPSPDRKGVGRAASSAKRPCRRPHQKPIKARNHQSDKISPPDKTCHIPPSTTQNHANRPMQAQSMLQNDAKWCTAIKIRQTNPSAGFLGELCGTWRLCEKQASRNTGTRIESPPAIKPHPQRSTDLPPNGTGTPAVLRAKVASLLTRVLITPTRKVQTQ